MYLVTGATGHIGNTLIRRLLEIDPTCKIRAFVLPDSDLTPLDGLDVEIAYGNILNIDDLTKAMQDIDLVLHLASVITINNRNADMVEKVNVDGSINVAQTALKANVRRMVHVASIHIFDRVPTGIIDETIPLVTKTNAAGIYDYTKAEAVRRLRPFINDGLDIIFACPTGVFGPNDYLGAKLGNTIRDSLTKTKHTTVDGGYDYVDVRDVAEGLIKLTEHGTTGEIYLLGGHYITTKEMLLKTGEILNTPYDVSFIPYPVIFMIATIMGLLDMAFDTKSPITPYSLRTIRDNANISHKKASDAFGYQSRPFEETLRDTINWYQDHPSTN